MGPPDTVGLSGRSVMLLNELLQVIDPVAAEGVPAVRIDGLTCDSRKVTPGTLFFAIPGAVADGHAYIEKALESGAAAVVLEDPSRAPAAVISVKVPDSRVAMARLSSRFYGDPTADLPLVGITGTHGKTTTTYLVDAIMAAAGMPPAAVGTI